MESQQLSKTQSKTQAKNKGPGKVRRKVRKPAYLQRKLQVSDPGDKEEQEADKVAADVKRSPRSNPQEEAAPVESAQRVVARSIARQGDDEEEEEEMMPKIRRQEEEEAAQPKLYRQEEEEAQTKLWRQEEEEAQTKLWRQEEEASDAETAQGADSESENQKNMESGLLEQRIQNSRGNGNPLPDTVLKDMEQQFNRSFSQVVIHNDNEAAELCAELNARAFTLGRDIYFAPGEFTPETERGRELLAHELTHVVQQGRHVTRKIFRTGTGGSSASTGSSGSSNQEFVVDQPLVIPPIKSRHGPRYQAMARAGSLRRAAGNVSDNRATAQRSIWLSTVQPNLSRIPAEQRPSSATGFRLRLNTGGGQRDLEAADEAAFLRLLKIPTWDSAGNDATFQVDHIVEHQLGGHDVIDNMELLDSRHNGSVGSSFRGEIRKAVRNTIERRQADHPSFTGLPGAPNSKPSANDVLRERQTKFTRVDGASGRQRRRTEGTSVFWSKQDIERLAHVLDLLDDSPRQRNGTANQLSILSPSGGLSIAKIRHGAQATSFAIPRSQRDILSGFRLTRVTLNSGYNTADADTNIGSVSAQLNLGRSIQVTNDPGEFSIALLKDGNADFAARLSNDALSGLPSTVDLQGASPVDLTNFSITRGLAASAILRPTHPLLQGIQIPGQIRDGRLGIFYTVDATALAQKIPIPGVSVNDATVTLGFDGQDLSVGGDIQFSVRNFGEGYLSAELDTAGNFGVAGRFEADSALFDQASLEMSYRSEGGFSIGGTLAITDPNKIKGIQSASITASYSEGNFSADGTVEPNIPGIEEAGLSVDYSEENGLTIGGNLQLAANPAIRSGSIEVSVNKQGDEWKVSATGTAQPAIPGVDSQLTVSYDDGAFTAEFSGAYQRGMLSGRVTVGASNRAIGEDGLPSGEPMADGALNIYGSGSATIQIAPWLQGTAGIRFDPNGEVTVSGEIGIPNEVEIFARREINKSIFNIAVQAPIVPGIVAEVGGGLSAVAGIGPGVIDELSIGITYNPAHEEDTRVTGDAHLRVPADAGLRLSVRAGIGLGITGASATGGLEIGGTLGIEGAAEAGVHIDWTPSEGLDITANLAVHAQPSFTFDIGGYVSVRALGFSVYDERWQFASYSFGSGYRFGIRLPVHYHEGEPFDISLDDVQFEVPDIDTNQLLRGLIGRIA